jgi:imidazolonepropionase-like amidohydrolase
MPQLAIRALPPLVALPLMAASLTAQAPVAAPEPVALVGATVVDGTGEAPAANAVVVVRDGRIACVGPETACAVPADAERIDVAGKWIIPGLVDAHVHYSQTGWADGRPDAYDARDRFPYIEVIAKLRDPTPFFRSYLCSGVTATFDVGGYPWTWGLRQPSDGSTSAPHVAAAGPLLSTRDHWLNVPAERQFIHMGSDSATLAGAQYLVANATDAVKVWFLAGRNSPDTTAFKERLRIGAAEAARAGIPLIVHATGLWQAKVAVGAGAHLLVHGVGDVPVDDEFLELARAAGTIYTPTLVVSDGYRQLRVRSFDAGRYDLACVDPETQAKAFLSDSLAGGMEAAARERAAEQAAQQDALGAANLMRVHRAGIPVVMGTDAGNPLTLHGPSVFLEMEAMQAAGMTPMEVLVSATAVGAQAMRRSMDFGTVEQGKVADLVVLDADPTADIRNVRRVALVVRGGEVHRREDLEYR